MKKIIFVSHCILIGIYNSFATNIFLHTHTQKQQQKAARRMQQQDDDGYRY